MGRPSGHAFARLISQQPHAHLTNGFLSWVATFFLPHVEPTSTDMGRAAESKSRPELESVGVDPVLNGVGARVGKIWPTPTPTRQQKMILAEQLSILTKTLKNGKKRRVVVFDKDEASFSVQISFA